MALIFCVVFIPLGNELPVYIILIMFGALLPTTAISFDTAARWDKYAVSLPVTRREIVAARYQLMVGGICVAGIISLIIAVAMMILMPGEGIFLPYFSPLMLMVLFVACGLLLGSIALPLTLKFVFFDGEEALIDYSENDGFHGSRRCVAELKRNRRLRNCRAMILLDMVGDRDLCLKLPSDTDPVLQSLVLRSARELGYGSHAASGGPLMLDDHTAFAKEGVPAVDLIDFSYGPGNLYWHTEGDTIDKISAESLGISAAIALKTIWKLMKLEP